MFGKNPPMNPLEPRKQLLIAESELNRAQLVQEWQAVTDGVHSVADRARTISVIASTAAALIGDLATCRRAWSAPAAEKSSWWQTLLKGVQLAGSLWSEFGPRPKS